MPAFPSVPAQVLLTKRRLLSDKRYFPRGTKRRAVAENNLRELAASIIGHGVR